MDLSTYGVLFFHVLTNFMLMIEKDYNILYLPPTPNPTPQMELALEPRHLLL